MREKAEWRAALSAMAALSGVGLASGRELVLFFAQLKGAAWAGVLAACALFGALTALIAARGGACHGQGGLERLAEALRLLFAALASAFMLTRLGELGAMTLPVRHSYLFGAGFGLLGALIAGWTGLKWPLGLLLTLGLSGFYMASALDGRPPRIHLRGETTFALADSMAAALLLAAAYAAMNACAAGWSLRDVRQGAVRPAALGIKAAALMAVVLIPGCAALARGGDMVLIQPMPWVVLSARWGLAGFWLCAAITALCALSTLSAALGLLISRLRTPRRALAVYMLTGALAVFAILSFGRF